MALSMPLAYYELQAPRSMHTKAMLVDGDISVFGSFNFDMRSAYSDTEVMLAVKSEPLNDRMEAYMLDMRALARPLMQDVADRSGALVALGLRDRLSIDPAHYLLCAADLSVRQAESLTQRTGLPVATLDTLKPMLRETVRALRQQSRR